MNKRTAVISEGDLSVKIPEKGFRETRYLAKNYNEAISRLEVRFLTT